MDRTRLSCPYIAGTRVVPRDEVYNNSLVPEMGREFSILEPLYVSHFLLNSLLKQKWLEKVIPNLVRGNYVQASIS